MVYKKTLIHFISKAVYPAKGGLEKSASRVLNALSSIPGFITNAYVTEVKEIPESNDNYPNIFPLKEFLLSPYKHSISLVEQNRIDFLILKNQIESKIREFPRDNHVIISFYISTTGYTAQVLADTLNIPHIASIRGSDLHRDLYNPLHRKAIEWVVNRANHIIATNNEQVQLLATLFSRLQSVSTILNAVEEIFLGSQWKYKQKEKISLFSDCGFSFKKNTQFLLKSVEELIKLGYPVQLNLVGGIDASKDKHIKYWKNLGIKYQDKYSEVFKFQKYLKSDDLLNNLLNSDIYVTSTLSEGCANGRLQALVTGIPIVSTKTGEIIDIISQCGEKNHIHLCSPGNLEDFTSSLERMLIKIQKGNIKIDDLFLEKLKSSHSSEQEKNSWEKVIRSVLEMSK